MAIQTVTFTVNATPVQANIQLDYTERLQDFDWSHKEITSGQWVKVRAGAKVHYKVTAPGYYTIEDDIVVTGPIVLNLTLNPIRNIYYQYTIKSIPEDANIKLYQQNYSK